MKGKILLLLMVLILFLQCCTTPKIMKMEIMAIPSSDQKIGYEETVTSQKKHFVSIAPYSKIDIGNRITFMMSIQNLGEAPLDISCDNISMTFKDNTKDGGANEINVLSLNDFLNDFEIETRLNELNYLNTALRGAGNKVNETFREGESFDVDSNILDLAYFVQDIRINFEKMHDQDQQILQALPDFIMSRQIIRPGDSYTGVMVCDTLALNPLIEGNFKISVSVDGEEHQFIFRRSLLSSRK